MRGYVTECGLSLPKRYDIGSEEIWLRWFEHEVQV